MGLDKLTLLITERYFFQLGSVNFMFLPLIFWDLWKIKQSTEVYNIKNVIKCVLWLVLGGGGGGWW